MRSPQYVVQLHLMCGRTDFAAIRAKTKAPLLATFRSKPHCGKANPETRATLGWAWRKAALAAGFDGIDLELDEPNLSAHLHQIKRTFRTKNP